uniref:Probable RNA-binding protein ARP1 isoform X2 n=1 Tax=Elaeis guineensis var. tenera TaxID=51953 RepID=A0A6I9RC32_ELAGV|nr:probable RNA-binding protein ARP1 isoform X2 [Elaeis guineensis]
MGQQSQFGDTTLTKVFVGGLAWETQKETLREHFDKYGEILEAVIISDKLTGRSKGYGFVTFKEAEAAKKACEDPAPVINGRRGNCNLASLGAKRHRPSSPATPTLPSHNQPGMAVGSSGVSPGPAAPWYYHPSGTPPPPPPPPSPLPHHHHQHYHGVLPFYFAAAYGYPPTYMADMGYNAKLSQSAGPGSYIQGQFSYPPQGGMVAPHGMLPVYPLYHLHHHQSQGMGVPEHFFPPTTAAVAGTVATVPTIISKPTAMAPPTTVEQVKGCS